jgi:methylmalonyl-CoA/ethylmalonyl-CoA epimerase
VFTGIHHVAVAVRSIDAALVCYRDVLGLPASHPVTVADQGVKAVLLSVGEDEIELLEPTNPAGGVARFLEKKGEGIHHLCVKTSDVAAALAQAKAANLPLIDHAPRQGLAGAIGFMHPGANHGILVELAQTPSGDAHPHLQSIGIRAVGVSTVYAAAKDPTGAAETLARNFEGKATNAERDARLACMTCDLAIGNSRVTLVDATGLAASRAGERVLAGRGDGLFGLGLAVESLGAALRHLEQHGIPTEMLGKESAEPLGWIPAARAHGVNLFLCPAKKPA